MNAYADSQLKALLAKDPDKMFPNGDGSSELLHSLPSDGDFPSLIMRDSNGDWGLTARKSGTRSILTSNGYVTPGMAGKNMLFHLRRPDNVERQPRCIDDPRR